jgi:N-glycosylase/DNA lyase
MRATRRALFPVANYDLTATFTSGQVFRWRQHHSAWEGVVGRHWVRLTADSRGIRAETALEIRDWRWLVAYLQLNEDIDHVLAAFPNDEPMRAAVSACKGLRLLRQEPWECLASFILSSSKQIVQIQQIITQLCAYFGEPVAVPPCRSAAFTFPSAERLAASSEAELRACKTGFRAGYLRETARRVATGGIDLNSMAKLPVEKARAELMKLPGVGRKIADCVLLFAYRFTEVFPIDVWVMKALRQLYFPHRQPAPRTIRHFADTHFGTYGGYAQQYLFHYIRTHRPARPTASTSTTQRRSTP